MAALRIDLTVFCNHITKNFQVKHDQCNSIIFLKKFLWKALNNYNKTLDLLTPGLFTFERSWNLSHVYHRTPCPAVPICKGV